MNAVRWVFVFPCAAIAGYLAYFIGGTINRIGFLFTYGTPPTGWLAGALDVLSHVYMGLGATYAAVRMAPGHPRAVAAAMTVFCLLLAGASILASTVAKHYLGIADALGVVFGSLAFIASAFRPTGNLTDKV